MKKYIIILGTFIFLMFALVVVDKLFLSPEQSVSKSEESSKETVSDSGNNNVIVHEVEDHPETDDEDVEIPSNIVMDGILFKSDWTKRNQMGLDAESLLKVMESMKGKYAYDCMEERLHQLYAEEYLILSARAEDIAICSVSDKDIDYVYNCVMADHPEIFYTQGYVYTRHTYQQETRKLTFSGNYTYSLEDINELRPQLETIAKTYLQNLDANAGEYEKVKYVYDCIINTTEYNLESYDNQAITSVFIYHESVCQGYAKAMQYLLDMVGVECTFVTGTVQGEGHSWNMVRIDGAYYLIDVTWGDASYISGEEGKAPIAAVNYDYFCITSEEMARTHDEDNVVAIPRCIEDKANYYVREDLYFSAVNEGKLELIFAQAYRDHKNCVMIKCRDEAVFYDMKVKMLEEQKIFDYLDDDMESLTYSSDSSLNTFTFLIQ